MTKEDCGAPVALTDICIKVTPEMKELASVSAIGPRQRNKSELTGLLHQRAVFASSLHCIHVEQTKLMAVGIAISSTWVGCHPHSRPHARTVLEALLRCHGDGDGARSCVGATKMMLCRNSTCVVHWPPEVTIVTSGVTKGPLVTFLANCFEICSTYIHLLLVLVPGSTVPVPAPLHLYLVFGFGWKS